MRKSLERYDVIVIGAGHNGLVCAAYLARAGRRVLVLDAGTQVGGLCATHEFHPGFSASPVHGVEHFPAAIARELSLASLGAVPLDTPARLVALGRAGAHVVIEGARIEGVDAADASAFGEYAETMARFAAALEPFWGRTIPRLRRDGLGNAMAFAQLGLNLRRLGKARFREFLRIAALPARDLVDERFDNELLKAALCWDGLVGSKMAPRSPNGAVLMMLYRHGRQAFAAHRLLPALETAAVAAGVTVRTNADVSRILMEAGPGSSNGMAAAGVELVSGERIRAPHVVSSADPRTTFLELLGVRHLDIGFTNRIRRLRADGLVGKLFLALDGPPEFAGLDTPAGRLLIAPDMDAIEFAFDDAKYGRLPAEPVLEVTVPSVTDDSLAPPGGHVLSVHVLYVPHRLDGGWRDSARQAIAERVIATLERHAPGLRGQIVGSEFLAPPDIAKRYRVRGGHWHHGDFAMDQMLMMRPTYDAAQYATPVPGLWLCGAGCHPAGDVTGFAGRNAARALLR